MIASLALALVFGQTAPAEPAAAPQPRPYISRFCVSVALNDVTPGLLRELYSEWQARPASDEAANAYKPQDQLVTGQMAEFTEKDAPKAFVDARRDICTLVYPSATLPDGARQELKTATVPLRKGSKPTPFSMLTSKRLGGHGPLGYFVPTSEDGRFGVCATIYDDLRLHDASPATMVKVQTCRLGDDETYDNG